MSTLGDLLSPAGLILFGVILSAVGAMWAASEQTGFERELKEKNAEIADLNRQALAAVTGGDSFSYMNVYAPAGSSEAKFLVVHQGDFPLYDVSARVVDLDEFASRIENRSLDSLLRGDKLFDLGNVSPNQARFIGTWVPDSRDIIRYNIFFHARNGAFSEELRLARVQTGWASALRVKRDQQVLLEKVDDEFPRDENGEVSW